MATMVNLRTALIATQKLNNEPPIKRSDPIKIDITRLPTEEVQDTEPAETTTRTTLHIYHEHGCAYKLITPTLSPSQERRWGPKPKEQKARRLAKKAAKALRSSQAPLPEQKAPLAAVEDENAYFLHTPYLSFHLPPSVLYAGGSKYAPARPVALIHTACFWRTYKIQIGSSLSQPGVMDPRGVVSWRHNGGSKVVLEKDEVNGGGRMLKGYKVRGWRLWGETGKSYVRSIRDKRKAGAAFDDPDVDEEVKDGGTREKVQADEVVYLKWRSPLSRHTRLYTFYFRGIEFQWKGTGTVNELRKCGWMLRFCHLKLVAKTPVSGDGEGGEREVCLAKYTSSIAAEKNGTLEIFDGAVVRLLEEHIPSLLQNEEFHGNRENNRGEEEEGNMAELKKGMLYQLIVATVLCMANAEKEKRHMLIDLVLGAGENARNGGG